MKKYRLLNRIILTTFIAAVMAPLAHGVPTLISSEDSSYAELKSAVTTTHTQNKKTKSNNQQQDSQDFKTEVSLAVDSGQDVFTRSGEEFSLTFTLSNARFSESLTPQDLQHTMHDFAPYDVPASIQIKEGGSEGDSKVTFTIEGVGVKETASVYSSDRFTLSLNAEATDPEKTPTVTVGYEGPHSLDTLTVAIGPNAGKKDAKIPTLSVGFEKRNPISLGRSSNNRSFRPAPQQIASSQQPTAKRVPSPRTRTTRNQRNKNVRGKRNVANKKKGRSSARTKPTTKRSGSSNPKLDALRQRLLQSLKEPARNRN